MIIELDTVVDGHYGPTAEDAARVITNGYDVTYRVVTEHGPGGGHPIIAYEGNRDELRRMVAEHYGPDTVEDYFPSSRHSGYLTEDEALFSLLQEVRDRDSLDISDDEIKEGHHRIVNYDWLAREAFKLGCNARPITVADPDPSSLMPTRAERLETVKHLIQATGANGAALDALVAAIVDAWEHDVEVQVARAKAH